MEYLDSLRLLRARESIYHAASVRAAAFSGVLALAAAYEPARYALINNGDPVMKDINYLFCWSSILTASLVFIAATLAMAARRNNRPLISKEMSLACRAMFPPMLVGACVGSGLILWLQNLMLASVIWSICYGLALLACAGFAPRSLVILGWSFLLCGLLVFLPWAYFGEVRLLNSDMGPASLFMAVSFGLIHLTYAASACLFAKFKLKS